MGSFCDGMTQYRPPVPPPKLQQNAKENITTPLTNEIQDRHIYTHPFDYDPDEIDDSFFYEFPDLFDWTAAPVQEEKEKETKISSRSVSTIPTDQKITGRKRKRSISRDKTEKKRARKDVNRVSPNRKKSSQRSQSSAENLFSYKAGPRKAVRSRKRTVDESLLVRIPFSSQEDQMIRDKFAVFGANWILISDILNSSLFQFPYRSPSQCSHHYHTNLSPIKSTKKVVRKGQVASPSPDVEYQADSFDVEKKFNSTLKLVDKALKEVVPSPMPCPEPHVSHSFVLKSLGVSFGITPGDVIRLQQQRASQQVHYAAPVAFSSLSSGPGASVMQSSHVPSTHGPQVVPLSSLNVNQAGSNVPGSVPIVNITAMQSHNLPIRSPSQPVPPTIPTSPKSRSVQYPPQPPK